VCYADAQYNKDQLLLRCAAGQRFIYLFKINMTKGA